MNVRWEFIFWYVVLGILFAYGLPTEPIARELAWIGHSLLIGIFFIIKALENINEVPYGACEITRLADELKKFKEAKKK